LEARLAGFTLVFLIAALAIGPLVWTADADAIDLTNRFAGLSTSSPLGTDDFGRDILSRMLHGGRLTLVGALMVMAGSSGIGLACGAAAGALGGRWDSILGRMIDLGLSLPPLVVALGITGTTGKSFAHLTFALVLTGWPWYARIYRSLFLRERSQLYVLAAHCVGCTRFRVLWRHIGPNILGPAIVVATVNLGNAMLSLAALSFLGLGVRPPTAEWGAMVSDSRYHFQTHPWLIAAPGLAIAITVLSVNTLGDALRDSMDPNARQRRW
jgi:peptide/nickel transport system permease protein